MKKLISKMSYKSSSESSPFDVYEIQYDVRLAANIIRARHHLNLTQGDLAKKVRTLQPAIARAESGNVPPSHKLLKKIARALNARIIPPSFELSNTILETKIPTQNIADLYTQDKDFSNVSLSSAESVTMERLPTYNYSLKN